MGWDGNVDVEVSRVRQLTESTGGLNNWQLTLQSMLQIVFGNCQFGVQSRYYGSTEAVGRNKSKPKPPCFDTFKGH